MSNYTNIFAVTDHFSEVVFNGLLSQIITPFLGGFGECLPLAFIPKEYSIVFMK